MPLLFQSHAKAKPVYFGEQIRPGVGAWLGDRRAPAVVPYPINHGARHAQNFTELFPLVCAVRHPKLVMSGLLMSSWALVAVAFGKKAV